MNQICEIVQYAGALFDKLTMNLPTLITRIGIQINIVSKLNQVDRIFAFRYRVFTLSRTRSMDLLVDLLRDAYYCPQETNKQHQTQTQSIFMADDL